MKLYLMQHGRSRPKDEDPERSLTDEGRAEAERVARFVAAGAPPTALRIFHSGKLRARQTAETLAGAFPDAVLEETDGLAPLDDPRVWAERLEQHDEGSMLVGHLPHLARLASLLLCGDEERTVVAFVNAGMVCLERVEEGAWSLQWSVVPKLVGS